jgi:hypothetical protein
MKSSFIQKYEQSLVGIYSRIGANYFLPKILKLQNHTGISVYHFEIWSKWKNTKTNSFIVLQFV